VQVIIPWGLESKGGFHRPVIMFVIFIVYLVSFIVLSEKNAHKYAPSGGNIV